jgi:hypothetical protein
MMINIRTFTACSDLLLRFSLRSCKSPVNAFVGKQSIFPVSLGKPWSQRSFSYSDVTSNKYSKESIQKWQPWLRSGCCLKNDERLSFLSYFSFVWPLRSTDSLLLNLTVSTLSQLTSECLQLSESLQVVSGRIRRKFSHLEKTIHIKS